MPMEPSDCLYLSPLDIYYSQDTIAATFHDGLKIGHTLDALVHMSAFVTDIPPITVVKHGDKYFSRNNRRLWVFKQLKKLGRCEYIPTILSSELPSEQFTTEIDGHEIIVRGDPDSHELRVYQERNRQDILNNIQTMINGPVKKTMFKFSPRFKRPKAIDKCEAKKRRIIRAKKRKQRLVFPKSGTEATGFDFDQYAQMATPNIAFSAETQMMFEGRNDQCPENEVDPVESDVNNGQNIVDNEDPGQCRKRKRSWHMKYD